MDSINPLSSIIRSGAITPQGGQAGQQQFFANPRQILKALVVETLGENRFVLDIGGEEVTAKSEAPLTPGQQLQLEVVKTSPQVELKIVTDEVNRFLSRAITLLTNNFDLGDLGKNLQQPALETVLPQMSGTSQEVVENYLTLQQTDISGKEGGPVLKQLIENLGLNLEKLLVQGDVQGATKTLKAALLELAVTLSKNNPTTETISTLLTMAENVSPDALQKNIESLLIALRQLPENVLTQNLPTTANQTGTANSEGTLNLKQLIDYLSGNIEKSATHDDNAQVVKTIKAALFELTTGFSKTEAISERAAKLISAIEGFQLAQAHASADAPLILPLPLPFIEHGYLLVENDGQGNTSEATPGESRFSLHLALTDLGNLRIDFLRNTEGLFIRFYAESQEKADFLAASYDELKESVSNVPLLRASFSTGATDPIGDLLRRIAAGSDSTFNAEA